MNKKAMMIKTDWSKYLWR